MWQFDVITTYAKYYPKDTSLWNAIQRIPETASKRVAWQRRCRRWVYLLITKIKPAEFNFKTVILDIIKWRDFFSEALKIISVAANHANNAMKKIERFKQLLQLSKKLGGQIDLVHPVRELLKEGDLKKISNRSNSKGDIEHQTRHVYLVR